MTEEFLPILYLKAGCPHCFKLRLFLVEVGLIGGFQVREWVPGDDNEAPIKQELAPHFEKVTFPTVQLAPGKFRNESDTLVKHYADGVGIDPQSLPLYRDWTQRHFPRLKQFQAEVKTLKAQLGIE